MGDNKMKHPVQPIYKDKHNVIRFKENNIVKFLLDNGLHDLNSLAIMGFSHEDHEQLAQLIGYSLSGFGDLDYVTDETYERAASQKVESDMKTMRDLLSQKLIGNPPRCGENLICESCEDEFEYDGKFDLYCRDCREGMELNDI
jgi:hypothetical protein